MKRLKNNNRGLTLIEILVSIAILGIIAVPLSSMFLTSIKSNQRAKDIFLASHLAQQYMEKLKASVNPTNEVIPPVDSNTGFVIQTEVSQFKDEDFGGEDEDSNDYVSIVDLINIGSGYINIYDGNGNYMGQIDIQKNNNNMNNITLVVTHSQLIFGDHPFKSANRENIIFELDPGNVDIKILYNGNIKTHIFIENNSQNRIINIFTSQEAIDDGIFKIKNKDSDKVIVMNYTYHSNVTSTILYKITVIVMDRTGTEQLAKLVGLKKAQ